MHPSVFLNPLPRINMPYRTGQLINEDFLLLKATVEETKKGKKYIKFSVRDSDGTEIEHCKRWDCSEVPTESVLHIIGKVDEYNGHQHIVASKWTCGSRSVEDFSPKAPWSLSGENLMSQFKKLFTLIRDKDLQDWTREFVFYWEKNEFPTGKNGASIVNATAAISIHHAYQHGWLEHVLEVIHICLKYRDIFENVKILNKKEGDLLIAGAYLHDIGKLFQFKCTDGVYEFSDLCKAYGWHSNAEQIIGSNMLHMYCAKEEFPPGGTDTVYALNNMIISHHGNQYSIGNSTYIISRLLHFADHTSADINRMSRNLHDKNEVERDKVHESYMRIK